MPVSPYKAMWLMAMFDLPVDSKKARKAYTRFRRVLLKDGFLMLQFSVYARFCVSEDAAKVHRKIVQNSLPDNGEVRLLTFTDHQFGKMEVYTGKMPHEPEQHMEQLEFF